MMDANEMNDSNPLPQGWKLVKLGEITKSVSVKNAGGRIQHVVSVTKHRGIVDSLEFFKKQVFSKELSTYKVIKRGQFAYATIHLEEGSIGFLADHEEAVLSPMYTVFEPKQNRVELGYLFTVLKSDQLLNIYNHVGLGSINRRKSIPYSVFAQIEIQLPPLPEQRKIAEILSTLDEKMAVMDEQLAQTQELKKGLMQRLLTKGIGHTQFKDSPLGEIPASWEAVELGNYSSLMTNGFVGVAKPFYVETGGVLYIQGANVRENEFRHHGIKYVTDEFSQKQQKSILKEGDLLTVQTGHIGTTAVVPKSLEGSNCHALIITRLNQQEMLSVFAAYYINSPFGKSQIKTIEVGSTILHVNVKDFMRFRVPLPPLPEQRQIAEILTTVDDKIGVLQDKKAQFHTLKKGLMQQLLTGQRRVRVATPEVAELV